MSVVRIIGVGTPYGDDRAGLAIAARLMEAPASGSEVVITERPGVELLDLLCGADAVIVLDAVRSGAAPGKIHDLALEELPEADRACSSHGIGVADTLALAEALGCRPRGRFIGIEARPHRRLPTWTDVLSPEVEAALDAAVLRVKEWVERVR
jgi:hydrogenase maturation protease